MKRNKFLQISITIICAVLIAVMFPLRAKADIGPKPSVRVTFEGLGDEPCYGTLLSKKESTGPSSAWDGREENARHNGNKRYSYQEFGYDVWKAFVEYEDTDGFYFLQEAWPVNESKELAWTYYPPEEFKILLYFPENDTFVISDIYERYAFDSYFTVNMEGVDISSVVQEGARDNNHLEVYRSYDYQLEILSLCARIVLTIMIEMVIALMFGYREKKQLLLLIGVNTATQIILNVLLNIIHYSSGEWAFKTFYVFLELVVFAIEALVFYCFLHKISVRKRSKRMAVVYAFVANAASFGAGLFLADFFAGIF